jgi:hypothetical protein
MSHRGKASLVESALILALMGIVAGAVGGLAIGLATGPHSSSPTAPSSSSAPVH